MEIAKIKPNLQIEFSDKIRMWLKTEKELAAFLKGDTLILKKIHIPDIVSIAERNSKEEMPLSEIVEEVHRYRQEKKSAK
ncbi:MAG: hypothetical protein ACE5IW_09100 [bacterium]